MFMYSEWVRVWVSDVSVVCVSEGCESEWSEWSEVKWVSGWVSECRSDFSEWVSDSKWVKVKKVNEWVWMSMSTVFHACHAKATPQCTLCHACHAKEAETQGTPGRTSDPLAVHIVPRLPRKRGGDPRDARAYIRPLGSAHCATPATQKRRRPKGRQGVHPTPWQCTLCHACHAKEAETQGTPGRTSDPLAVHIVPRLPRKRGGDPRDARAYIRPLGSAHCATPATQKRRRPKGRQGVHPTPWQCTLSHACHAKEAETRGTPGRTSDPLAVHIVPRLPRKSGGDPRDARAYIRPLGSAHCATPATQKRRRPKGRGRTSDPLAVQIVPRLPRKRGGDPRDARAYIRPLGSAHCATPATQKRRRPKGRQGIHPTPWQCTLSHACHAKEAETQGTPGRTSDPLAVQIVPRLPRKRGGDPRDARAYIRPLGSAHCPTPATQKRRRPEGRQGVHPTPWQCTLCHACRAKEAETQGTPGRTSDPLAVHIVPRLPRKRGGDPRDARAYIRPLGSAHCPTPATQKRRRPKGRQGVHPTPWQCTLCHACHAKEAETQGTPGRTSDPLAVHIVPRLPRKMHMSEWVCAWVCEWEWVSVWVSVCHAKCTWVSEWVCAWVCEWEWVSMWVSVCVCEWEWVCVCEWVCEWVSVWVSESEWVCEWVSVWVSECVSEWEWVSECVSEWVCEWVCVCVWVSECVCVCVSECVCVWGVSEWVGEWVSERVSESVSEWVRVSEWVWVCGEWVSVREAAGGGYRTKNKNPTRQCGEKQLLFWKLSQAKPFGMWIDIVGHGVDRDNRAWLGVESLGHGCIQRWPQCSLMTSVNDASLQSRPTNGSTTWDKNRLKSSDQLLASSMEVKEIQLRWYCSSGWKMCLKLQLCAREEATGQQRDAHIRSWPGVAVYVPDSEPGQYHGQTWSENKCMVRLTIF